MLTNIVPIAVLTHGPPHTILDKTLRGDNAGCPHILKAVKRVRPRLHCFGHIHEGWGAEKHHWENGKVRKFFQDKEIAPKDRCCDLTCSNNGLEPLVFGKETLFVNASILNGAYRPVNAPWLVDLDLPVSVI